MNKFNYKKIIPRYSIYAWLLTLASVAVIAKALYIMTVRHDFWMAVAERQKRDSMFVKPTRGNILSCDGELMASSLPEFKLYMDFHALHEAQGDSLWMAKRDSVCMMLSRIFPEKSKQQFMAYLEQGRRKNARHWPVWDKRVNYNVYTQVKDLPVFRMVSYKGGFHVEEFNARQRPYGSLAGRTVGDMFGAKDTARCGLELSYDSILRGTNGITHRRKVLNKFLSIMDTPPIDGADIVTTIDVGIQDLAERSVIKELKEINADVGVAIVMEVATGDVKAIVNMEKCIDGQYREIKNHAVSDLLEPGSVFKPASILVALDDGMCDTTLMVETGNGVWDMYGRKMKDHNWTHGGYGTISLPRTLEVSSNVGVSRIIDQFYHNDPEKFVNGIYRLGLADNLHIPILGFSCAHIRMPKKNSRGQYVNWSKTTLPWMSIGYETQVPPITTLTFYNAIANGGKMMRPRFVKSVVKDGETVMEFPPVVQREQIAKPSTIKTMQTILTHVVSQGLGRKAGSESFQVAGKTGTAQISQGRGGYHSGVTHYLVSFAGFFPADKPLYSCIVCIQKRGLPASGGGMSGPVFKEIAEGIMAKYIKLDVNDARDSASVFVPNVKNGNLTAADFVLNALGFKPVLNFNFDVQGNPVWGVARDEDKSRVMLDRTPLYRYNQIPNVIGMGARDAVYLVESRGVRVRMQGRGKVVEQSLPPGRTIRKGDVMTLKLE
ncbi:MAG: penicillin-binding protein [Prevotella sp.]|nr:transpeptidase family protein [Bacteroidales bacterium]MDY5320287.1 penicillin-binding protein [Prevotella sp.]